MQRISTTVIGLVGEGARTCYEYLLTQAGRELQPILLALKEWGDRHCNPGAEPVVFQHTCGADFHPLTVCADCLEPLRDGELTVTGGTHPVEATM
jgi:hypothetical protein